MPYHVQKQGSKWCVHKGHTGEDGGEVPGGCHGSRSEALAHLRALYVNVPDASKSALDESSFATYTQLIRINGVERTMIVADTIESRIRGLAGRDTIPADGMLFKYDKLVLYPFTASQMMFPIVVSFFDAAGKHLGSSEVQPGQSLIWAPAHYQFVVECLPEHFVEGDLEGF